MRSPWFDWDVFRDAGIGHGMQVGGRNIGGLFDLNGPEMPPGIPPCIGVMVKVESVDARLREAVALGGSVTEDLRHRGTGPDGRLLRPQWRQFRRVGAQGDAGSDADSSLHDCPSWSESLTTDVARATEFYCELFGWTAEVKQMPGVGLHGLQERRDGHRGHDAPSPRPARRIGGHISTVDDADEAARKAEELGRSSSFRPWTFRGSGGSAASSHPRRSGSTRSSTFRDMLDDRDNLNGTRITQSPI